MACLPADGSAQLVDVGHRVSDVAGAAWSPEPAERSPGQHPEVSEQFPDGVAHAGTDVEGGCAAVAVQQTGDGEVGLGDIGGVDEVAHAWFRRGWDSRGR